VGDKEMESGEIAVRSRKGDDLGKMSIQAFIDKTMSEVDNKHI
jgi:threonyl-tRNA synthetase